MMLLLLIGIYTAIDKLKAVPLKEPLYITQ